MSAIMMNTKLSRKYIPKDEKTCLYLMVELIAQEKTSKEDRLPLNLGYVIDRSGSMSGDKLAYTKQAIQYSVNHLVPSDYASLTVFDDQVDVLIAGQPIIYKDQFKSMVNQIFCGGCTNLSGGLSKGYREVMKHYQAGQLNRVLLLTDGLANKGITDKDKLCRKVKEMKNSGVSVTALGVGDDFDEDLLTAMAEASGGKYFFIECTDKIPQIFAQEMQSLLSVIAQNVTLQFCPSENANVTKVWGYCPSGDRDICIELPDVFAVDRKIIVMELEICSRSEGQVPLGALSISYEDTDKDLALLTYTYDLTTECTPRQSLLVEPEEIEVMLQVEMNRTSEKKEEAIRLADEGNFVEAAEVMRNQHKVLYSLTKAAPSEYKQELAIEMEHLAASLHNLREEYYDAHTRKTMAYESYQRRRNQK